MNSVILPKNVIINFTAVVLSVIAGLINGIVGAGSGIVFMLIARILFGGGDPKQIYSFSIMCVIPVSLISLLMYPPDLFPPSAIASIVPCGVVGGILGAVIKDKLRAVWLNLIFAALTVYSGFSMILR